jgi:hypothetical protein
MGNEPRASDKLDKHSTTELPSPTPQIPRVPHSNNILGRDQFNRKWHNTLLVKEKRLYSCKSCKIQKHKVKSYLKY